jgi:hypothetical protein
MTQRKFGSTLLVGAILCSGPAYCQAPGAGSEPSPVQPLANVSGVTVFGGLRVWANQWDIPSIRRIFIGSPTNPSAVLLQGEKDLSKTEFVPIPFVGLRAGNYIGSVSYFPRTSYDSRNSSLGTVRRDEFDVTLGYAVAPSAVLSVAYKHGYDSKLADFVSPSGAKIQAILIGASGSAPLAGRFSIYGNVAYGFAREKTDFSDVNGESKYSANYQIGEVGASYLLYEGSEGRPLKNVSISLGYRAQTFTVKSVPFGTVGVDPSLDIRDLQKKDVRTTTEGLVLGIVGSF